MAVSPRSAIPDVDISVNDVALPPQAWADLRSVTVQDDLDAMSMFAFELDNWDDERLSYSWSDAALFSVGAEVRVSLGFVDDLHHVMLGETTSFEPRFASDGSTLTIRGYDLRHRLARGRKTRTFVQMADSAIASQLAREAELADEVTNTDAKVDHVLQSNMSDWEFLQRRAKLQGFEVYVRDKTLHFGPPRLAGASVATLRVGAELIEFSPRLSAQAQLDQVAVRGWDVKQKQAIVGRAQAGQEATTMGGDASGPSTARVAFGGTSAAIVDVPLGSAAEAGAIARGWFDDAALDFIHAEATADGQPEIRAGSVVTIEGAGERFSGTYYVTSVTHTLSIDHGFRSSLALRRNAA
jgi:phage protein D